MSMNTTTTKTLEVSGQDWMAIEVQSLKLLTILLRIWIFKPNRPQRSSKIYIAKAFPFNKKLEWCKILSPPSHKPQVANNRYRQLLSRQLQFSTKNHLKPKVRSARHATAGILSAWNCTASVLPRVFIVSQDTAIVIHAKTIWKMKNYDSKPCNRLLRRPQTLSDQR